MEADCLDLRSKEGEEESEGVSSILGQNSEKLCPMLDLECMSCGAMFSFGPHLHREKYLLEYDSCMNVCVNGKEPEEPPGVNICKARVWMGKLQNSSPHINIKSNTVY